MKLTQDFGDTLLKLEKSFGIKYDDDCFKDAKTFGDICKIIESKLVFADKNDCTTQQAFYKVRRAISRTQNIAEVNIKSKTRLEKIFPRSTRRQRVKKFKQELGIPVNFLTIKRLLGWAIAFCFLLSIVAFFFDWQIAVGALTLSFMFYWTANKFAKELSILTVADLAEKISREHYSQARRHSGTANKNEIVKTIQNVFIADYLMDRADLTEDASLGWA